MGSFLLSCRTWHFSSLNFMRFVGPFPRLWKSLWIAAQLSGSSPTPPSFVEGAFWPITQVWMKMFNSMYWPQADLWTGQSLLSWRAFLTMLSCRYFLIYLHMLIVDPFYQFWGMKPRARHDERSRKHPATKQKANSLTNKTRLQYLCIHLANMLACEAQETIF